MGNVTFQKKVNGSMQTLQTNQPFKLNISNPNLEELTIDPSTTSKSGFPINPDTGYNGFSTVKFTDTQNILISDNIKQGVTLFGVQGNITGGGNIYTNQIKVETNGQVIIPSGYDGASNILVDVPSGGILEPYDIYKDGAWYDGWEGTSTETPGSIYYYYDSTKKEFKINSDNMGGVIGFIKSITVPAGYLFLKVTLEGFHYPESFKFYLSKTISRPIPDTGTSFQSSTGDYYYYIPNDLISGNVYLCFGADDENTSKYITISYVGFTETSEQ